MRSVLASTVDALRKARVRLREGWPAGINATEQWHTYYFLLLSAMAAAEVPDEALPSIRKQAESSKDWRDAALVSAVTSPHKVFLQMQRRQLRARAAWQAYFREYDAFLMPVAFIAAFPHEDRPDRLRTADGERPYSDLKPGLHCRH